MGMFKCKEIDCFACTESEHCSALTSKPEGKECPFFKTVAQNKKDQNKALDKLIIEKRFDLINKYYTTTDKPIPEVVYVR